MRKKTNRSVSLDSAVNDELEQRAFKQGRSVSSYLNFLLKQLFTSNEDI